MNQRSSRASSRWPAAALLIAIAPARRLADGLALEATASHLFDRQLFQGMSFLSNRTDVVAFDPGLGLSLQLFWRR